MNIGERIKIKRIEKGWSQRDLAAKIGYSNHSTVGKVETGKVDLPQSKVVQFAEVLGVSVAYLMGWEEMQKKNDVQTDIVVRLRTDSEFASLIEGINQLNPEQLASIKQVVDAFLKG
jgi:transcriptional regulator with XRE-family HTH domain